MTEREIFLEALEISTPEARAAYLKGACAGDVALHGKVEELLKEHFANDSLMAGPAVAGGRSEFESQQAPAPMLDRYKLLEKIGEGGSGEVWMAEQREPIKRRVALKIIKLGMDSRQIVARFEVERQALAMMDHANIAKIFDAGTTDTGRPYFVMELVRGIKITEYCDQKQFSTRERLKEAEPAYRDALALQKQLVVDFPNQPEFRLLLAQINRNLGNLLRKTGRPKEAELVHVEALTTFKQLAVEFPNRAEFRQELADAEAQQARHAKRARRLQEGGRGTGEQIEKEIADGNVPIPDFPKQ